MIRANGVDGVIEHAAALVSSYPAFMAILVASALDGSGEQSCIALGSTTVDAFYNGGFVPFSDTKYVTERTAANGSDRVDRTAAPQISSTIPRWLFVYFAAANDRRVAFGSSTFTTGVNALTSSITSLNRSLIGAARRSSGLLHFAKADLGEAWWGNALPSSTQLDELVAGTRLPENLTGIIDGVYLDVFQASGNYTSHTGTRTFVASGGISASPISHPVTRNASAFVAGATLARTVAGGSLSAIASSFVTGATLARTVAGGTLGPAPGVLTSQPLTTNNGTILANTALDWVDVYLESTGLFVARFTGVVTNALGIFSITSPLFSQGTDYKVDWRAPGGQRRMPVARAA